MKLIPINILSAVIFPFVFSACVSQSSVDFNKQQAAKARVELALGYLQQNDFVQAKLNLDKALEHDERYYLVHSALAHCYQLQGDTEKAKQAYLQAIKLDDKQGDVYNNFKLIHNLMRHSLRRIITIKPILTKTWRFVLSPENKPMFINRHWINCVKLILLERKSSVHSNNHCQKPLSTLEFSI